MEKKTNAILVVADISGYTQFMRMHGIAITHAKQIVVRLLKSLIKISKTPLKVEKLEGDAVFFYAFYAEDNFETIIADVKKQLIQIFNSFQKELELMKSMKVCNCPACTTAGDLKLKQVV